MRRIQAFISKYEYDIVDSTQNEAIRLIQDGRACHGSVVFAKMQGAGRGKFGKSWIGNKGNLYLTMVVELDATNNSQITLTQAPYVVALCVGDAIRLLLNNAEIQYKWVNDVLIDRKKISGILLEKVLDRFVLIGIGMNLKHQEEYVALNATSLEELGLGGILPGVLGESVLQRLQFRINKWIDYGFEFVRREWMSHAINLNQLVKVHVGGSVIEGVFTNIDEDGALMISTSCGQRKIYGADIFEI